MAYTNRNQSEAGLGVGLVQWFSNITKARINFINFLSHPSFLALTLSQDWHVFVVGRWPQTLPGSACFPPWEASQKNEKSLFPALALSVSSNLVCTHPRPQTVPRPRDYIKELGLSHKLQHVVSSLQNPGVITGRCGYPRKGA